MQELIEHWLDLYSVGWRHAGAEEHVEAKTAALEEVDPMMEGWDSNNDGKLDMVEYMARTPIKREL